MSMDRIPIGILDEYQTLRSEIQNAQARRLQIISFTMGAFGIIITLAFGFVIGASSNVDVDVLERQLIAVGSVIVLYSIEIPSLLMSIAIGQNIRRLGNYIRKYIEPVVPGLHWESIRQVLRENQGTSGQRAMGGIFFFLSALPLLFLLYGISLDTSNWLLLFLVLPFATLAIYLSYDLQHASSKGWRLADLDGQLLGEEIGTIIAAEIKNK